MKKLIFLTLFALASCGIYAQPVIKFDKPSINFGTFSKEKEQVAIFEFTNEGNQPLVIQQAFASCGCTVPTFPKDPIAPGKKGKIMVTYNGKSQFPGDFKKPVSIRSNATNKLVRIFIEGTMQDK